MRKMVGYLVEFKCPKCGRTTELKLYGAERVLVRCSHCVETITQHVEMEMVNYQILEGEKEK